jgi:hypothetical protein
VTVKSGIAAQLGMAEELYVNEVQTITGTPSATFGLNYDGALTTVSLTTTATAASIQTALNALPNLGNGLGTTAGVTCTGGPLPSQVTVTFSGTFVAGRNTPALVVQGAVTGLTIATGTPGTGYGDAQTVTRFLEFTDESLALNRDVIESTALRTGNRLLRTDRQAINRKGAGGDINFEVANTGFGLLFKHMFGTSAITTPTNGVLTRDHTYQIADPTGKSLTLQVGRPDTVVGTVNPFAYKGSKINGWELSQALDGILMLKTTIDSMDEDQTISLAAASYPSSQTLMNYTSGQATIGGANVDVTGITLTYDPALNTARYFVRNNTLKKEPLPNALIAFTGSIDMEFSDLVAYSRFTGGTLAAVTMTWTGALIESVASPGPYSYQVIMTLPQVRFDGTTPNVGGPDVLTMSMPIKVLWDGTTSPTLVYRTTDTTD